MGLLDDSYSKALLHLDGADASPHADIKEFGLEFYYTFD